MSLELNVASFATTQMSICVNHVTAGEVNPTWGAGAAGAGWFANVAPGAASGLLVRWDATLHNVQIALPSAVIVELGTMTGSTFTAIGAATFPAGSGPGADQAVTVSVALATPIVGLTKLGMRTTTAPGGNAYIFDAVLWSKIVF